MPFLIHAANLEIVSEGSSRNVGEAFTAIATVDPKGMDINAVTGSISYDRSKLVLKAIDVNSSAVSFWVVKPIETEGKINFEGVLLDGGSLSSKAEIFKMIFETRSAGSANVSFSSGSVLSDDGKATNILEKFINSSMLIKNVSTKIPTIPTDTSSKATIALIDEEFTTDGKYRLAIIEYPTRVLPNERVVLRGVAGANDEVSVKMAIDRPKSIGERFLRIIRNDPGTLAAVVETDDQGGFSYTFNESLVAGVYSAWAEKVNASEGEQSKVKSSNVIIEIKYGALYKVWIWLINTLLLIIPILLLGGMVFIIFWRGRREIISAEKVIQRGNSNIHDN